jgi:fumarate reductase flavoprotein subunit
MSSNTSEGLNRRDFLKAGTLAAAVMGGAALVGCSPSQNSSSESPKTDASVQVNGTIAVTPQTITEDPFFNAPAPIADVSQTYDYDVVVVGAGISGTCAALAAAENGAKVGILSKTPSAHSQGILFSAFNVPEVLAETNADHAQEIDIDATKREYVALSSYNINYSIFNKFFDVNPEAAAWLLSKAKEAGLPYRCNGQAVMYLDQAGVVSTTLAKLAEETGNAEFYYSTPGVQLVQDATGAITGVIGQSSDGAYIQLNASAGVILAAGCYGANPELKARWCPQTLHFDNYQVGDNNTGDAHMMGIWAGACVQQWPHTKKVDPHLSVTDGGLRWNNWNDPFLAVNDRGERFMDEGCTGTYRPNGTYYCPESHVNLVFDSQQPHGDEEELKNLIDLGFAFSGKTLEELGGAMGFDATAVTNFSQTVDHYNGLCDAGLDPDYYKDPKDLIKVETGPFYAVRIEYMIGALLGGLEVDENCNVVDTDMVPIAGLYAVGNTMGGMQGSTDYQFHDYGLSLGAASTFGYYVGKSLALR